VKEIEGWLGENTFYCETFTARISERGCTHNRARTAIATAEGEPDISRMETSLCDKTCSRWEQPTSQQTSYIKSKKYKNWLRNIYQPDWAEKKRSRQKGKRKAGLRGRNIEIRKLRQDGKDCDYIAGLYKISPGRVYQICKGDYY